MTTDSAPEKFPQIIKLLSSVARLVAEGSALEEGELRLLLAGVQLENEPQALEELQRWGTLLVALHNEPTPKLRRATSEALRLRGLREGFVNLAVDTVVGGSAMAGTHSGLLPDYPFWASVESLDFGTLATGQTASKEFEVHGGPGKIESGNAKVQVKPTTFEVGTTKVQVQVQSPEEGTLQASVTLVVAETTLEIPVVAKWQKKVSLSDVSDLSAGLNQLFGVTPRAPSVTPPTPPPSVTPPAPPVEQAGPPTQPLVEEGPPPTLPLIEVVPPMRPLVEEGPPPTLPLIEMVPPTQPLVEQVAPPTPPVEQAVPPQGEQAAASAPPQAEQPRPPTRRQIGWSGDDDLLDQIRKLFGS
jgi:hypothetical protein